MTRDELIQAYVAGVRDFRGADLRGVNLSRADLADGDFTGADFTDVNFKGANLKDAKLSCARLERAQVGRLYAAGHRNFCNVDLHDVVLSGLNLTGVELTDTNLRYTDLSCANLTDACLSGADLSGAKLRGATLVRTDFRGADLNGVDLTCVDFSDATLDDQYPNAPDSYCCPIARVLMDKAVVAADGHSYEEVEIRRWLRGSFRSPLTGKKLKNKKLIPNYTLRRMITEWKENTGGAVNLFDQVHDAPQAYCCPITKWLMDQPVLAADGHSYDKDAITQRLGLPGDHVSTVTRARLENDELIPNHALRCSIAAWKEEIQVAKPPHDQAHAGGAAVPSPTAFVGEEAQNSLRP